jgi:hypothetical protein
MYYNTGWHRSSELLSKTTHPKHKENPKYQQYEILMIPRKTKNTMYGYRQKPGQQHENGFSKKIKSINFILIHKSIVALIPDELYLPIKALL